MEAIPKSDIKSVIKSDIYIKPKKISKRGNVLKVRGVCYNYRFKL